MTSDNSNDDKFETLRRKAEELISREGESSGHVPEGVLELIQELRVHQVELQIQNEELQQAQRELAGVHQEYVERYYENAPCGYVTVDPRGFVVRINQAGISMLGVETCNLQHTPFRKMIATESRDAYLHAIQQIKDKGDSTHVHLKLSPEFIRPIWVRTDIRPDRDENGSVFQYRMTLVDITEVVEAEKERRKSKERLQSIIDAAPFGAHVYELDSADRLVFIGFNKAAERILETDHRGFIQKTITEAFPPLAETKIPESYAEVAATGKPYDTEQINYDHGSISGIFEVHAVQSEPRRMVAFFRDITEKKKAEEALEESEARFRTMANGLPLIVWVHDADGRQQFVNRTFHEFFGVSSSDLKDDRWRMLLHPEDEEIYTQAFSACVQQRRPFNAEVRVKRVDGQWRWVESWGEPRFSTSGEFLGFVGASADITDRKEAEASLKRLNRTLEQKVAERTQEAKNRSRQLQALALELIEAEDRERERIAQLLHDDLQQHLAMVKMKLDMLRPMDGGIPQSDEALRRCMGLLSEAIDKTRKLSHELSPPGLRFSGLLSSLDGLVREIRENYGLELDLTASQEVEPESHAVKVFLYQALKELLFNVVKHSGAETAHIDIGEKDDWIVVRVADSGKGAELDQVYARRGHEPGFGLFSIEERVQSLGGRMTVETIPGDGWVTTLFVPKARAEDETGPKLQESGEVVFRSGKDSASARQHSSDAEESLIRIVIVDDHIVMREGLASLLEEQSGMKVVGQAGNGVEALAIVRDLLPDLVLMDVSMPDMDGIESTEKLVSAYPHIHIVGLSMHEDPTTRQNMLSAGAVEFLCKTDAPQTIIQVLRRCAETVRRSGQED